MRWTIQRGQAQGNVIPLEALHQHLRLFTTGSPPSHPEDDLIETYARAAVSWAEGYTRREIAERQIALLTDCLRQHYDLPVSPVQSLTSAEYLDDQGDWQPLDVDQDLASDPPQLTLNEFPDDWAGGRNSVRFVVEAGYESIPDDMLAGLLLLIGHWYENRESVVIAHPANKVPLTTETILWPFRALTFER